MIDSPSSGGLSLDLPLKLDNQDMKSPALLRILGAILLAAGFWGCGGGGGDQVPVYPVSGTITIAGNPVANAVVTFSPEAKQPVAMGRTDTSGKYTLTTYDANDGAAVGEYKVMVTKAAPSTSGSATALHDPNNPRAATEFSQQAHAAARKAGAGDGASDALLPEKYSRKGETDLRATVTEDGAKNAFDFDLQP
jgi:hypothetical protein